MTQRPFLPRLLALCLLTTAVACASATTPVTVPGAGEATVPRGAVQALEAQWPRVELGTSISRTCPGTAGAPTPLARGDFNGDGVEDVVLWITTEGTPRLVALLARLDGEYSAVEIGQGLGSTGPVTLEVARRGTGHRLTSLNIESFFSADTVVLGACDGARTGWFWNGSTFESQSLAN